MKKKILVLLCLVISFILINNVNAEENSDYEIKHNSVVSDATLSNKQEDSGHQIQQVETPQNQEDCIEAGGIPTTCGIPSGLATMITDIYNLLKIGVPIVLIVMGMIDLLKGVTSQKEDEIKKEWHTLIRRTIYGVITFFVFTTVQLIISLLPNSNVTITNCVKTFFTGDGTAEFECIMSGANTSNTKKDNNQSS